MMLATFDENGKIASYQDGAIDASVVKKYNEIGMQAVVVAPQRLQELVAGKVALDNCYVTLAQRPATPVKIDKTVIKADGRDTATLSGIPTGATVRASDGVNVDEDVVTESVLTYTGREPHRFQITVEAWPYLPFACELEVQ